MDHLSAPLLLILASLAISAIAVVDTITGGEISVAAFYLLPIAVVAWRLGVRWGLAAGATAAFAWYAAALLDGETPSMGWIDLWNAGVRLTVYSAVALPVAALHRMVLREAALARTDALTGLPNDRAFEDALGREIARAERAGRPFTLALFDLDDFKRVNDTLGHGEGDRVLRAVGRALEGGLRTTDVGGRLGGDEFGVLMAETSSEAVSAALKRLHQELERAVDPWGAGVSMGAVTFQVPPVSTQEARDSADAVLYAAKRTGKGRVRHAGSPPLPPGSARASPSEAAGR